MNIAYIPTQKVRHLAIWTRTYRSGYEPIGLHRAICGRATHVGTFMVFPNEEFSDPDSLEAKYAAAAMRRPVCGDCLKALDELSEAAK